MPHSLGYFSRRVGLLFVSDEDPLAGSNPGRKSHFPRRFSYNAAPNRFSIDRSVVPLMPSRLAAPSAPDDTPFVLPQNANDAPEGSFPVCDSHHMRRSIFQTDFRKPLFLHILVRSL
jgi:hypothetical protein